MMKPAISLTLFLSSMALACTSARAQIDPYKTSLPVRQQEIAELKLYDLNGDGKIDDWEREKVNQRLLNDMDLNHDGVIDEKDRQIAREMIKKQKAERQAEIRKYDKNGDGKLDESEEAARRADEAKERARQKPSQAALELSRPMVSY